MKAFVLVVLAACGASEGKPAASVHVAASDPAPPIDASVPDVAPDAPPAGAVPLPDPDGQPPLEEVDTTIGLADLAATQGKYRQDVRVARGGRQLVVLHVRDDKIWLSIVEDKNGIVKAFELEPIVSVPELHAFDGDAYAPRRFVGDYSGPILFAIRLRHGSAEPWHQLVVFVAGDEIRVVERRLDTTSWTRRLRVRLDRDVTVEAIGTTDPH